MPKSTPLAVLCSDLHLSIKPPLARSNEKNWFDVMGRMLLEIDQVAGEQGGVPIICAGDIFDKWNSPAELINFALEYMPHMYAIPGQHDLPFHDYKEMNRSAFGTLVSAEKVTLLDPEGARLFRNEDDLDIPALFVHAFPWGFDIKPILRGEDNDEIHLAVCHKYIWSMNAKYEGAPEESNVTKLAKQLAGFDAAVFGDNHLGFEYDLGRMAQEGKRGESLSKCFVWNNGTVMRRKIDEIKYKPRIGILMSDGTAKPHFLNTSKDAFISKSEITVLENEGFNIRQFISDLDKLGSNDLDFREAVDQYLEKYEVSKGAIKIILSSLES